MLCPNSNDHSVLQIIDITRGNLMLIIQGLNSWQKELLSVSVAWSTKGDSYPPSPPPPPPELLYPAWLPQQCVISTQLYYMPPHTHYAYVSCTCGSKPLITCIQYNNFTCIVYNSRKKEQIGYLAKIANILSMKARSWQDLMILCLFDLGKMVPRFGTLHIYI